jgi:hypothetical protein
MKNGFVMYLRPHGYALYIYIYYINNKKYKYIYTIDAREYIYLLYIKIGGILLKNLLFCYDILTG